MPLSISKDVVIGKFNYRFCASMLQKLEGLIAEGHAFEDGVFDGRKRLTRIAGCVASKLIEQISYDTQGYGVATDSALSNLVATAREFLAIFGSEGEGE